MRIHTSKQKRHAKLEQTNYFKLFIFSVSIRIDSLDFNMTKRGRRRRIVLYFALKFFSTHKHTCSRSTEGERYARSHIETFALVIETKMNNDCALLRVRMLNTRLRCGRKN